MPVQGQKVPSLDLVFALDCTGSMGPYISQATQKIEEISKRIFESKLIASKDFRVGIVAYRDYHPQDFHEFTTKVFKFTSDMSVIKGYLAGLKALGGGDGPEAVATALYDCAESMAWNPEAAQVIVIITDAPPHGLNPKGVEGFPKGDPHLKFGNEFTPAKLLQYFVSGPGKGMHILTVQCEPTLTTQYPIGNAFYTGLSTKTNGRVIPLGRAETLSDVIVAFALETLSLYSIISKLGGEKIADTSHKNAKFHTLFRAVAGKAPSDAEVEKQLMALYSNPPDDLAEQIEAATSTKTPDEAIAALRTHLKDEQCHKCESTVSYSLSAEGRSNVDMFMRAHATGVLDGPLKHDSGTKLVGDVAGHTVSIKQAPLSNGQIKRLAHIYTSRFSAR